MLGCKDSAAKTRLFREKGCNLKKSTESLRISETTSEQLKKIQREGAQEPVNFVKIEVSKRMPVQKQPERPRKGSTGRGRQSKEGRQCRYCGGLHDRDKNKCPAFGKTCKKVWKIQSLLNCLSAKAEPASRARGVILR